MLANAGCGLTYNVNAGQITASATMRDSKGNTVQVATVDAGYIASAYASPGFGYAIVENQTTSSVSVQIPGLTSISQVAVLIQNWNVQYDSVHNVQSLQIGTWGPPQYSSTGNVVVLPNLYAQINDNSGNYQDNSLSSATVLVIALP